MKNQAEVETSEIAVSESEEEGNEEYVLTLSYKWL
jgi:hypothetical protein